MFPQKSDNRSCSFTVTQRDPTAVEEDRGKRPSALQRAAPGQRDQPANQSHHRNSQGRSGQAFHAVPKVPACSGGW